MEFYLGIDFGTTNSAIAKGGIEAYSGKILPEVFPIDMDGTPVPQQIVPSVAMYKTGERGCQGVGFSAKQHLKHPDPTKGYVAIKSVKLQLGDERVANADWLRPEEVAADILRFMKRSFEQKWNLSNVKKAVIGIPASFPADMCDKTVQAGKLAGFSDVTLIVEPQAALLDFMHEQSKYEGSSQIIDFTEPKIILIFDLGGGTLDVSLVKASQTTYASKSGKPLSAINYEALGLSRFTTIGGDLFDTYLADFFKDNFRKQTGFDINSMPDESGRSRTLAMLLEYAEATKHNLTFVVNRLINQENLNSFEAMDNTSINIVIPRLVELPSGSLDFSYELHYKDYVEIIEPLLGFELSLSDFENDKKLYQLLQDPHSNNAIIPIFDALGQAKRQFGNTPKVDAILLNGGMARVHIIKERLKHLFDLEQVYEITHPDLSVAQGAVIHHYNLTHNLDHSRNILAESILLEGEGGYIELVKEGAKYPTQKPILHPGVVSIPRDGITHINLPLYRGKSGQKIPIIDRMVQLKDKAAYIKKGDALDIQIEIDKNRALKFEAWLHDNPQIRFDVVILI